MKRTLTSIAAASMVLGTVVPVAFASSSTWSYNNATLNMGTYSANIDGVAAMNYGQPTEFLPVYYLEQGLKALGYTVKFDGAMHMFDITTPAGTKVNFPTTVGNDGTLAVSVNGQVVNNVPFLVQKDPASGVATTFVPVYYLNNILNTAGLYGNYSAGKWAVTAPATLKITGNSNVAVGSKEALSLWANGSAAMNGVTWSVDGNGNAFVDQNGNFTATAAGTYNVTASYQNQTATATVVVYGAAAGIKLAAASSSLVANGASTDTITATVVDANGNPVTNFNGTVNVSDTGTLLWNTTGYTNALTAVAVTNGVATFSVKANVAVGQTDTITATAVTPTGGSAVVNASGQNVSATTTVSTVQQVATSIKVSPAQKAVENNQSTQGSVTAEVLDQTGNPMLSGTYPIMFAISGAGTFAGSTTPVSTVYTGSGNPMSPTQVTQYFNTTQGQSGTITVSASGTGLQSGSATVNSVEVGTPAAIQLAVPSTSSASFSADTGSTTLQATVVDGAGNPTGLPSGDTFNTTATVTQNGTTATGVTATVGASSGLVTVTGTAAGTYTVTVTDAQSLLKSATYNVTITAGAASVVKLAQTVAYVPESNATTNVTAQLYDKNGNPVSQSGVTVGFSVSGTNTSGTATINGGSTATATTNAQGQAVVGFSATPYVGNKWTVTVTSLNGVTVTTGSTETVTIQNAVASKVVVALADANTKNAQYNGSTVYAQAGDNVTATVTAEDQYGNAVTTNDAVQVTLPAGLTPASGSGLTLVSGTTYTATLTAGKATFTLVAGKAGAANVAVADQSVTPSVNGSSAITVVPGTAVGVALQQNGAAIVNPLTVAANTPVAVTVVAVDAGGNQVVEPANTVVALSDASMGGVFRLSSTGSDVTTVTIPAGQSSATVYYVNGTAGSYTLSAGAQVATAFTVSPSTVSIASPATTQVVSAKVVDQFGNAMAGVTVNWTVAKGTDAGTIGTLSSVSSVTNASGVATVTYTQGTGASATTDVVTGAVSGLTSASNTSTIAHS